MSNFDSQVIFHGLSIDISNSLVGALIPHGYCLSNERCSAPPLAISCDFPVYLFMYLTDTWFIECAGYHNLLTLLRLFQWQYWGNIY